MDQEIWKDVKGFGGLLQVSNLGNARRFYDNNKKPIIYTLKKTEKGYLRVIFKNKGIIKAMRVHRLVAQAFIPNPLNKPQVNHIDGNKLNNRVDNLEWVTNKENSIHASKNNLLLHKNYNHSPILLIENGKIIKRFESIAQASRQMKLSYHHIFYQLFINKKNPRRDRKVKWVYEC